MIHILNYESMNNTEDTIIAVVATKSDCSVNLKKESSFKGNCAHDLRVIASMRAPPTELGIYVGSWTICHFVILQLFCKFLPFVIVPRF